MKTILKIIPNSVQIVSFKAEDMQERMGDIGVNGHTSHLLFQLNYKVKLQKKPNNYKKGQ